MMSPFFRSFNGGSSSDNSSVIKETYRPEELDDARLYEAGISSGINFNKYSHIPCKVTGENPPHAIETFADSGECEWWPFYGIPFTMNLNPRVGEDTFEMYLRYRYRYMKGCISCIF